MNLNITISESQKKSLTALAAPLKSALEKIDVHHRRYAELMAKDKSAEKQVAKHQRAAANFDSASELQLIAALKQRERLREALGKSEEQAFEAKLPLWKAIDEAHSAIEKTLKGAYEQLLDHIVSEAGQFFDNAESLRVEARNWPVVHSFVRELLMLSASETQSSERLVGLAEQLLSRIDALLSGKFIWSYAGASK